MFDVFQAFAEVDEDEFKRQANLYSILFVMIGIVNGISMCMQVCVKLPIQLAWYIHSYCINLLLVATFLCFSKVCICACRSVWNCINWVFTCCFSYFMILYKKYFSTWQSSNFCDITLWCQHCLSVDLWLND